ncbi:hypothetical protein [Phenylobacterium sp.]|jgi:hypothetical protein|uniref:hypothetical protein n=1 Tax=Phenylobacterium sp. TaxID=1871053 RepID=UPI003783EAFE
MGLVIAAALAAPAAAHARALNLYLERTAISAADARCGLFAPAVSQALAAGVAQARGAALRAGTSAETLASGARSARARAAQVACTAPALAREAARVRDAFDGYGRVVRMSYPGDVGTWRADRLSSRKMRWRLAQDSRFGGDAMTFGLVGDGDSGALMAVARFADGKTPYAARLRMRDADRTLGAYLDRYPGGPTAKVPLARRLPPGGSTRAYMAEARSAAGQDLLPPGAKAGWAFRFPALAVQQLTSLDPREAVVVEFLFAEGPRRAYLEVGDFAAGRAFLQVGAPQVASRSSPRQVAQAD